MSEARIPWEGSTRRERLPDNWDSEVVPRVFDEYGHTCYVCGEDGADEVDHVKRGDDHRLENLRPIHGWRTAQKCHARKSGAEGAAGRAYARESRREPHPAFDD